VYGNLDGTGYVRYGVHKNFSNARFISNSHRLDTSDPTYQSLGIKKALGDLYFDFSVLHSKSLADNYPTFLISYGVPEFQVDIGHRAHVVSYFEDSALLIGQNAQESKSITFSNSQGLGQQNWRYLFFVKQLAEVNDVMIDPEAGWLTKSQNLMGTFLSFKPIKWFEVGLNRSFQFAGEGRNLHLATLETLFSTLLVLTTAKPMKRVKQNLVTNRRQLHSLLM
jgi:hypothetical protein